MTDVKALFFGGPRHDQLLQVEAATATTPDGAQVTYPPAVLRATYGRATGVGTSELRVMLVTVEYVREVNDDDDGPQWLYRYRGPDIDYGYDVDAGLAALLDGE